MSYLRMKPPPRALGASGTVKWYGTSGYTGPSTVTVTAYKDPYDTRLLESRSITVEELKMRDERIALLERISRDVLNGRKPPELSDSAWASINRVRTDASPTGRMMWDLERKLFLEWPAKLKAGTLPYAAFMQDGKRMGRFYGSATGYKGVVKEIPEPKSSFEIIIGAFGDVVKVVVNAVKAIIDKACGLVSSGAGSTIMTVTGPTGAAVQQTAAIICGGGGVVPQVPVEEPTNYLPFILLGGAALAAFLLIR